MKKVLPAALVFVAGLILLSKFAKGGAIATLNYNISGIRFNFSGLVPVLSINIAVQNTSNQSVLISSLAGDLYINGDHTSNISSFEPLNIPANSEAVYTITARLSLTGAISNLIDIVNGRLKATANIRFTGHINIEQLQVPVDLTYKIIPESLLK